MTITRIGLVTAALLCAVITTHAWAQDTQPTEPADEPLTTEQSAPDTDAAEPEASSTAEEPQEQEQGNMDEVRDPATEDEIAKEEETGPGDMISDSSERALVAAELEALDCEELWIARNEIFDRNGYCFRSARGQDYFDNSDCTSDSQDILSPLEWDNVKLVQQVERDKKCN